MKRIFVPTVGPCCWRRLLADPDKHWRDGRSAKLLAERWEAASGFPPEISHVFARSGIPSFQDLEMLLAFPEYQVPLPGGTRPSQCDLFALARGRSGLVAIAIEGKVAETFGPTLAEWQSTESEGKQQRLSFLCAQLQLAQPLPSTIRYQLLHRTACALLEARRYGAQAAAMIVHSFGSPRESFDDYAAFLALFGASTAADRLLVLGDRDGTLLCSAWANGPPPCTDAGVRGQG